jgi:hypothetical protein
MTARLSAKELARYRCLDCGVNVVTAGEFYMLNSEIWEGQLGLGWSDNLCIGCLETRLGRKWAGRVAGVSKRMLRRRPTLAVGLTL